MIALFCVLYTFKKTFPGHIDQPLRFLADVADAVCPGRVRMVSLIDDAGVQAHDIALPDKAVGTGYAVHHFVIHRHADGGRVAVIIQEGGHAAVAAYQLLPDPVYILGGHSRMKLLCQFVVDSLKDPARYRHKLDLSG